MNQKKSIGTLFLTTVLVWSFSSFAHADQSGTATAQFLKIQQGARAEGMGGAFTAIANDARAVNWNPAGLAQLTRSELSFDHLKFFDDIKAESFAGVIPVNNLNGSLGVGVTYVDFGSFERLDNTGVAEAGQNDVKSYSAVLSWGQAIGDRFAIGAGVKYIRQDLAEVSGSGLAADLGILYFLIPDRLSLGASYLNLGQKIKTGTESENIPRTLRGGAAYYILPQEWVVDADVVKELDSDAKLNVGSEYIYHRAFIGRVGYQDNKEAGGGLSLGAGFIWRPQSDEVGEFMGVKPSRQSSARGLEIRFDYAYVDYGDLDKTHRVGVNVSF